MRTRVLGLALALALLTPSSLAGAEGAVPSWPGGAAWITYWDDAVEEALIYEDALDALVYFAAFFAEDDSLFLPPELSEMKRDLDVLFKSPKPVSFLSFVNDYTQADGTYLQKDTALLGRVLKKGEDGSDRPGALIKDMLRLATENGYQGIEIDFEALRDDLSLWTDFLDFVERLYAAAKARGLSVRVLLEPRTPVAKLSFPEGPEYVMMCYNLYGTHSGPGPKANEAFLREMAAKMAALPEGSKSLALATGGFDWWGDQARSLTYAQAEALRVRYGQPAARVEEVLRFWYTDESGVSHEVWYADEQTLAFWAGVIGSLGEYGISVWRLGGNLAP